MPCRSDYMDPTTKERDLSRVQCLLDELDGIKFTKGSWRGYHPKVYGCRVDADALVAKLCSRLKKANVREYSLEMQIWWRDHLEADYQREKAEAARKVEQHAKTKALAKLTETEKKLLGLK